MKFTTILIPIVLMFQISACRRIPTPVKINTTVTASPIEIPDSERARLRDSLKQSDLAYRLTDPLANGKMVPHFRVRLLGSHDFESDSTLIGRSYLIHFWATHCGPCVAEMGDVQAAYEKYSPHNFTILSIATEDKEYVNSFRKTKWTMPWYHACIFENLDSQIESRFKVAAIPSLFLIGPSGTILAQGDELRGEQLQLTLSKFIK